MKIQINKQDLIYKYVDENKTAIEIALEYNCSKQTILKRLKEYNIKTREKHSRNNVKKEKLRNGYEEISGTYWYLLKQRAKNRGIQFNITIKDAWEKFLKQDRKCSLSGIPLYFNKIWNRQKRENREEQTASLDRIDSSKEYCLENIQWVHKDINKMKWDMSQKDFIKICDKVKEYNNK